MLTALLVGIAFWAGVFVACACDLWSRPMGEEEWE